VKQSEIEGFGLFANEIIKAGSPVWEFTPGFDQEINPENLDSLSEPALQDFKKYAYFEKEIGKYILCFDSARFFNHAENPNIDCPHEQRDVCFAKRDIAIGEELTCDYRQFDASLRELST
jgi:SET domain-containing protein